jgi:hypothetical protein
LARTERVYEILFQIASSAGRLIALIRVIVTETLATLSAWNKRIMLYITERIKTRRKLILRSEVIYEPKACNRSAPVEGKFGKRKERPPSFAGSPALRYDIVVLLEYLLTRGDLSACGTCGSLFIP